mgnify:CR=1 FL=1
MNSEAPHDGWIKIGEGASAQVWALDATRVVKLFEPDVNEVPIALEYEAGRWADALGLPVGRPIGRVVLNMRSGILFERRDGPDMLSFIMRHPHRMWKSIWRLARLHARVHQSPGSAALPRQRNVLRHRILRSHAGPEAVQAALDQLDRLDDDDRLAHGDFHPANILMSSDGPAIVDWAQASSGSPAADAARTELLLRFGGRGAGAASALTAVVTARWYRRCYLRFSGVDQAEFDAWRLPVAVAWHRGQLEGNGARIDRWIGALISELRRR